MLDEITLIIPAKSEKESLPKILDKLNMRNNSDLIHYVIDYKLND